MEISILQTDFIGSPQLLSQDSIIGDKNNCIECRESDFQKFFYKANEGINNNMSDKIVTDTDNANSEITTTNSMEISASLFLSILGINSDITKLNQVIDLKSIGNKDLENITAVDFLKNIGFSENDARGMVAQVLNASQKFEGINKTGDITQISFLFGRQVSQIDYKGSSDKNIPLEGIQKDISVDSLQIQESLKDIKNIVSDKLKLSPSEIKSQFLQNKEDALDRLFDKASVEGNLKILNDSADSNSLKTENEDFAANNKGVKVSYEHEPIGKKESSSSESGNITDSLSFNKSFPENRDLSIKYAANTDLKGFDSVSSGIENKPQSSKASLSNSVINQIVENAQIIVKGDKKEIKIHLDPPSLGSIHMKITMDSHSMKATMIADTPHVKEVIESSLNELKRSLADSGIKVEQFSVFVGHGYSQSDTMNTPIYRIDEINIPDAIDMTDSRANIREEVNNQNLINIFV